MNAAAETRTAGAQAVGGASPVQGRVGSVVVKLLAKARLPAVYMSALFSILWEALQCPLFVDIDDLGPTSTPSNHGLQPLSISTFCIINMQISAVFKTLKVALQILLSVVFTVRAGVRVCVYAA